MNEPLMEFLEFALAASWDGCDLSGGEIQDEALRLGLIIEVPYDPEIHGENDCDVKPGDPWYVIANLGAAKTERE
jgi:hypothetical protein